MPLPLEGIRVLDFSSYIAGPYCPALLGDRGQSGRRGAAADPGGLRGGLFTATLAAYGVMTALFVRERTGIGQKVETSLLQGALAMQAGRFIWAEHEGRDAKSDLPGGINRLFKTKEEYLYISAHTETFWQSLCTTIGIPHIGTDARYNSMSKRSQLVKELVALIEQALESKTAEEWEHLLTEDVWADAASGPALGEHTEEVLHSLGYTPEQCAELKRAKVI